MQAYEQGLKAGDTRLVISPDQRVLPLLQQSGRAGTRTGPRLQAVDAAPTGDGGGASAPAQAAPPRGHERPRRRDRPRAGHRGASVGAGAALRRAAPGGRGGARRSTCCGARAGLRWQPAPCSCGSSAAEARVVDSRPRFDEFCCRRRAGRLGYQATVSEGSMRRSVSPERRARTAAARARPRWPAPSPSSRTAAARARRAWRPSRNGSSTPWSTSRPASR